MYNDGGLIVLGICSPITEFDNLLNFGFEFLEVRCDDVFKIQKSSDKIFCANSFIPAHKQLFSSQDLYNESIKYCCDLLLVCSGKGISHVTLGSGRARYIDNYISKTEVNRRWCNFLMTIDDHATQNGITIGLEPLNRGETNFINTFKEAKYWIDSLNLKSFGITFDTYHIEQEDNDLLYIAKNGIEDISHVHISDKSQHFPISIEDVKSKAFSFVKTHLSSLAISIEPVPFAIDQITRKSVEELLEGVL